MTMNGMRGRSTGFVRSSLLPFAFDFFVATTRKAYRVREHAARVQRDVAADVENPNGR